MSSRTGLVPIPGAGGPEGPVGGTCKRGVSWRGSSCRRRAFRYIGFPHVAPILLLKPACRSHRQGSVGTSGQDGRACHWRVAHPLDILTKAMLCCRSWGALPVDPARGEDDENGAGVEFIDRMSLDDVTRHLSRQEAAKFFHHVLVGVTTGMVTAIQRGAYEPHPDPFQLNVTIDGIQEEREAEGGKGEGGHRVRRLNSCSHGHAPRGSHVRTPAIRPSRPSPKPTNLSRKTVSVAIGASCVENAVSHELGSLLAGQLARGSGHLQHRRGRRARRRTQACGK